VFSLIHLFKKASHIFKCNVFISGKVLCSVLTNLENIYLCTRVCFSFLSGVMSSHYLAMAMLLKDIDKLIAQQCEACCSRQCA